jgi:YegS/Rv2252/BmrU family lipid kinase
MRIHALLGLVAANDASVSHMHAEVILNPVSGRHVGGDEGLRLRREAIEGAAQRAGVHATMRVTSHQGHALVLARDAASRGVPVVVAWGGDGTVNEVASGLAFTDTALGIVPAGSGNGLARQLGLPWAVDEALAVAFTGDARRIDLGELNDRLFVNVAGIGFDARVARAFNAERTSGWGLPRYVRLALREVGSYEPQTYHVTCDGLTVDVHAYVVAVANSAQYGNGARIAPHARIDDGVLDVVVVNVAPVWKLFLGARRLFDGSIARAREVRTLSLREGEIASATPMPIHVDGEPLDAVTHARVRVRRGALLVVSPE